METRNCEFTDQSRWVMKLEWPWRTETAREPPSPRGLPARAPPRTSEGDTCARGRDGGAYRAFADAGVLPPVVADAVNIDTVVMGAYG